MLFNTRLLLSTAAAITLYTAAISSAHAVDRVKSPNVVKGELEFEYMGVRTFDSDNSKDNEHEHEFEIEYGVTDRLSLEIGAEVEKEPGESLIGTGIEIGGQYQLFEQGENWLDSGIALSYGHATHDGEPNEIKAKLLLEKQHDKLLHIANFVLEQEVGNHAEGGPNRELLWSSRYLYSKYIEPGFEIQSSFGKTNENLSFNEQEHYAGPAIYGKLTPHIKYEAAIYAGLSDAATDAAARLFLEYEIYF